MTRTRTDPAVAEPGKDPAPAVTRALAILGLLEDANGAPLSLSDLARGLDAAKSSTSNICATLESGGMIRRVEGGYRLGRRTAELGGAFARQFNQIREFYPVVEQDEELRGEVVQIAMLDGASALYLARYEGRAHRVGTPLGSRLPAVASATGLAMLANAPDALLQEVLGASDLADDDAEEVRRSVLATRQRGYSVDPGRSFEGIWGVAVPLEPWRPSDPPLALGVALPTAEASDERIAVIARSALAAARRLTNPMVTASLAAGPHPSTKESR